MRFRVLGVAALAAAALLPQAPASAWACYGTIVKVCDLVTDHPKVCVLQPGGVYSCYSVTTNDICVWDPAGNEIVCPPIVWPPV